MKDKNFLMSRLILMIQKLWLIFTQLFIFNFLGTCVRQYISSGKQFFGHSSFLAAEVVKIRHFQCN